MTAVVPAALEVGIATLADIQPVTVDGRHVSPRDRLTQLLSLGERAESLGLDVVGVGEHHSADFAVPSPAVLLAALAARTSRIRLTSAVTVLSVLDPVRVYEGFASLDLLSDGRAEVTVGRSAYTEPFTLFGAPIEEYDELFAEKLDLLLRLREPGALTWSGRYRAPLRDAVVGPPPAQQPLPVWVGVGGTPGSAARAGTLGLPMTLGYIGGSPAQLRRLADVYRAAGAQAGHRPDQLRLGVALHYLGAASIREAKDTYRHYRDCLRPKRPGSSGFVVGPEQFDAALGPDGHLMIGLPEQVTDKLVRLQRTVRFDRVLALLDWGGLPPAQAEDSLDRLGLHRASPPRRHTGDGRGTRMIGGAPSGAAPGRAGPAVLTPGPAQ